MRQQLVKFRTMQSNGLRGVLTEYRETMGIGRVALNQATPDALARLSERLPATPIDTLREQWDMLGKLDLANGRRSYNELDKHRLCL